MLKSFKSDSSWRETAPPIPAWGVDKVHAQAVKLFRQVFRDWIGIELTRQSVDVLAVTAVTQAGLPETSKAVLAVHDLLMSHVGRNLTVPTARLVCLQLASNWVALDSGTPIAPFISVVGRAEWMPLEIYAVGQHKDGTMFRPQLRMLVLAGEHAGHEVAKLCPGRFLSVLAYDLGYNRRRRYEEPSDLVGLRLAGLIQPSSGLDLAFEKYWLTSAMMAHNRAIVRERRPTEKEQNEQQE